MVSTLGAFKNLAKARKKVDMSSLKCLVIDEADFFFGDTNNYTEMTQFHNDFIKNLKGVQYILFSATYTEEVKEKISKIVTEA
jgi:superfamily II DNA/RNA helicase